jgi:hypothetical protein
MQNEPPLSAWDHTLDSVRCQASSVRCPRQNVKSGQSDVSEDALTTSPAPRQRSQMFIVAMWVVNCSAGL